MVDFIHFYNHECYQEGIGNVTPADVPMADRRSSEDGRSNSAGDQSSAFALIGLA